jgi:2,4-dienoyl-CoA reductase (NADPH2)
MQRGGLTAPAPAKSPRQVYLLQRKTSKVGAGLGKTSGWVHRSTLAARGVETIRGVTYHRIDDAGLHISVGGNTATNSGRDRILPVDDVVVCAGQESRRDLFAQLQTTGVNVHLVGGAHEAFELDATRAIDQGTRLAASL